MSKARDISNLFSASTSAATDAEVTSAVAAHAASTTNRHYKSGDTASRPASPTTGDLYSNTQTGEMEVYETNGWIPVATAPQAPTGATATNSPSGRAFNNGRASVAFTPATSGAAGTTYTVTSTPGSYTASGSSSPILVTGLQSSTQYTYVVSAANSYGSANSAASAGVTATTVPQAPTIDSVTGGDAQVSVAFTAGATGGSAITGFTVTSSPGSLTASGASSPLVVTGLTNETAYTFTAVATNANGTSAASSASSSVTPIIAGDYESIATVTVGSGGAADVTFSSIPATYTHLQIRYIAQSAGYGRIQFNSNTTGSNYYSHYMTGIGGGGGAVNGGELPGSTYSSLVWAVNNIGGSGSTFRAGIIDIVDYKSTNKNKTVRILHGVDNNGSGDVEFTSGLFKATPAAITTIKIFPHAANTWSQYTSFALYGIRGE